ncbi:MAG: hypothetical protein L0177_00480 [Chloroflexi bacterium]|nr:hypothetical protein [Chloroflexota bacterium]
MGLFGKKKKNEEDLPEDEVSAALEEAGFFSDNEKKGAPNEEEALLNQYLPGGGGLNLSFDNETQSENSEGAAPPESAENEGIKLDDDLLSIFTDEEVSDMDISALTEGLQDVDISSLLSDLQDAASRLRGMAKR